MRPSSAALAAGAALLAACAGAGSGSRAAPLPARAARADVDQIARLLALLDARSLDSQAADELLASPSPAVRRAAALGVGQNGDRALAPRLRPLLVDGDTTLAASAAFALGLLADTGSVPALRAALVLPAPVASEAAWSLGEIGGPARRAILAALTDGAGSRAPETTAALLLAAGRLRPVPTAVLAPFLGVREPRVRRAAAYALSRSRPPSAVRPLLPLGVDGDPVVRSYVARALAHPATGDSLAAPAMKVLAALAADADPHVRVAAARSLATFGPGARFAVHRLLADPDRNVRVAAAEAAGDVLGPAGASAWSAAWDADTTFAVRRALLASGAGHPALAEQVTAWSRAADWRRRAAAAQALGAGQGREAAALALTGDADPRVRSAALGAVGARLDSAGAPAWVRDTLRQALSDSDAIARATVLGALAGRPRASEFGLVREAYRRAATDRDNDARVAALRYLAALWRADSVAVDPATRAWLETLPAPATGVERAAAAGIPGVLRWPRRFRPPRPRSWYAAIARDLVVPALGGRLPRATLHTAHGPFVVELLAADAPLTAHNFIALARAGTFGGTAFHRVVAAFVAQGGDPRGDGNGGPGYVIRDEHNRRRYERGAVGMALSGPNTGGSQFFVTLSPQPHLDGHYTVFARVASGWDVVDRLVQGDSLLRVTVEP